MFYKTLLINMSVAIRNTKHEILKALVEILEGEECGKITTKTISQKTDVTESALYKHYKNKQEIFNSLYQYIEVTIADKITEIKVNSNTDLERVKNIFYFLVLFVEKNRGFARLLTRESLTIDEQHVIDKVQTLFDNIEIEFLKLTKNKAVSSLLVIYIQGILAEFVRSKFTYVPSENLDAIFNNIASPLDTLQ
jgi:AcrR family transcriptional regulator